MKWFEHPQDEVRGFYLKEPYSRIFIGCDPRDGMTKESADSFDAFINVSDTACTTFEPSKPGQQMHWYPVNEGGLWNLSYLYWLKTVMDHHFDAGHRIYLHCHAGAYRSPSAAVLWLQSRGYSPEDALLLVREKGSALYRLWNSYDNIPKLKDQVFKLMNEHPNWSLGAILHETGDYWNKEVISGHCRTTGLKHRYFWFYYLPKWWIRNRRDWLKDWLGGKGFYTEGFGTYIYKRKHFWAWPCNAEPNDINEDIITHRRWNSNTKSWEKTNE